MPAKQSAFLHWAKMRPKVKYDLASSGILNLSLADLDVKLSDLELHGENAYGYPALVDALAAHCKIDPECVVTISGGASMANHLAMAAVLRPGGEILLEEPTYEPVLALAQYFGAAIKRFPRKFERGYSIDLDELLNQITTRTRLIVLTNLHNPSSVLTDEATLREVGELASSTRAHVLIDEVYLEAMFEDAPKSSVHLGRQFIATSSLTKGYGLSGLRCGWILADPELAEKMRRLNDIFGTVGPHVTERLTVVALSQLQEISARAKRILGTNRATLNQFFDTRRDLDVVRTKFGTTSFPRVRNGDGDKLSALLLAKYDTAVVPGRFFESPQHVRIGTCCEPEVFATGIERFGRALDEL
jgi:aspartate/methionine/tyrosine aminotransferase